MFSQSCVSGFHRISDRVKSRAHSRLSATTPSWRHIWSSTHTKRPSLDHTRNCQPSPNQLSNFNFQQGHRLPPYIRHRFRHPRAHTTPHHSIIHAPKIPVHHPAPNKFQISKGSPPPTPIVATDSVIHAHTRPHIIPSSTHRKYQSTIQHSSNFNFLGGSPPPTHRLRTPTTPTSTHIHNTPRTVRRPLPHLGVYVTGNMRCDVIIHTAAPSSFGCG